MSLVRLFHFSIVSSTNGRHFEKLASRVFQISCEDYSTSTGARSIFVSDTLNIAFCEDCSSLICFFKARLHSIVELFTCSDFLTNMAKVFLSGSLLAAMSAFYTRILCCRIVLKTFLCVWIASAFSKSLACRVFVCFDSSCLASSTMSRAWSSSASLSPSAFSSCFKSCLFLYLSSSDSDA